MLKVIEIKSQTKKSPLNSPFIKKEEQENLEKFLKENGALLLQSPAWGEFQAATGKKVWNLVVVDENFLISLRQAQDRLKNNYSTFLTQDRLKNNYSTFLAVAQIVEHQLPAGKCYLYCPRGPVIKIPNAKCQIPNKFQITNFEIQNILKLLVNHIGALAIKEKAVFLRIEPEILQSDKEKIKILKELGFKKSQREIQPKDTLVLDLTPAMGGVENLRKSEEELLKGMHYKTRYNIRLAEKRGVKVRQSINQKDIEFFYQLLKKTALRDNFSPHEFKYYQKQIEILGPKDLFKLFLAEYQGKIIAGILVSFYNERATYMHGAHNKNFRNLMAPHLLQWQAILEAKKRGCRIYDFWGIAPAGAKSNHPWQGITRFKRGFGGREVNYVGGWDFVFSPVWYFLYNLAHRFKNNP